jgi:hypothetical protein
MKLSTLLANRSSLLRRAQLANLAYAYSTLRLLADRIARAKLTGWVRLRQAGVNEDPYEASLDALEGNQSLIEEHFTDQEIVEMADSIAFAEDADTLDIEFPIEELREKFVDPLRLELKDAGVTLDIENRLDIHTHPST